jgi:2,3,4,5-tetrahydropyridine-2-carboxylate N-succinyltransferase
MQNLQVIIETAFEKRQHITAENVDLVTKDAILKTVELLDKGQIRVAEKQNNSWSVNQWVKKAVLLYFRIENSMLMDGACTQFFDKVPLKYENYNQQQFQQTGVRVVPFANVRKGAYIGANTVVMPSFVNIGAYVDSGTLIDTWATVGSCAQIGKNVHLSGGAGIGGVLEPVQANPTIIEDNCFIGARSEIVEGVIVEEGSVISMGLYLGQSTRIYDRETGKISYGRIPAESVVVSGNLPSSDGKYSLYCAVIVKRVDAKTREKISLNELLRCP